MEGRSKMGKYRATFVYSLFHESKGEIMLAEMKYSAPFRKPRVYDYSAQDDVRARKIAQEKLDEINLRGDARATLESIVKIIFEKKK